MAMSVYLVLLYPVGFLGYHKCDRKTILAVAIQQLQRAWGQRRRMGQRH